MFAVNCPRLGTRTLVFPSDLKGISNTPAGIAVEFTCACGATGAWLTGRDVEERLVWHGDTPVLAGAAA